jgi:hypothetical protein
MSPLARDYARALIQTEAYVDTSGERKKIEALFGEAKNILSMVRLRLRGLSGARDEFLLTATVQNLKKAGRTHRKTAPADHDGLTHAAKTHPTRSISQYRLSSSLRRNRNVRYYQQRTPELGSDQTCSTHSATRRHPSARNRSPHCPQEPTFSRPSLTSGFDPKQKF